MRLGSVAPYPLKTSLFTAKSGSRRGNARCSAGSPSGSATRTSRKIFGIATKTVGKHIEHLLAKLHAENRTAAVKLALEQLRRLASST